MADICLCGDEWGSHLLTKDGSCSVDHWIPCKKFDPVKNVYEQEQAERLGDIRYPFVSRDG